MDGVEGGKENEKGKSQSVLSSSLREGVIKQKSCYAIAIYGIGYRGRGNSAGR